MTTTIGRSQAGARAPRRARRRRASRPRAGAARQAAADPGSGTTTSFENPYWWKEALFPVLANVNVIELLVAVYVSVSRLPLPLPLAFWS